jgi:hypothetical protein
MDPNKDVVLDVSSTSSDSDEDFVSPLQLLVESPVHVIGMCFVIVVSVKCHTNEIFVFGIAHLFLPLTVGVHCRSVHYS